MQNNDLARPIRLNTATASGLEKQFGGVAVL
jgi:hypothetical protein